MVLFWRWWLVAFLPLWIVSVDIGLYSDWCFWLPVEFDFGQPKIIPVEHFVVANWLRSILQFLIESAQHFHVAFELAVCQGVDWKFLLHNQRFFMSYFLKNYFLFGVQAGVDVDRVLSV